MPSVAVAPVPTANDERLATRRLPWVARVDEPLSVPSRVFSVEVTYDTAVDFHAHGVAVVRIAVVQNQNRR